jgi:hypothetical protein
MGLPFMRARGFPGKRVDPNLEGIIAAHFIIFFKNKLKLSKP